MPKDTPEMTYAEKKAAQAAEIATRWAVMKAQARAPTSPAALEVAIGAMDRILNGAAQLLADHDEVGVGIYSGGDGCGKDFAF